MIPILFDRDEQLFTSEGIARLTDCTYCEVEEILNGLYECEFGYPVNGPAFSEITEGRVVLVRHDDKGDLQPFDIYARSAPDLKGIVTFYGRHVSYRLFDYIAGPYTAGNCVEALDKIRSNTTPETPFTFWTSKTVTAPFAVTRPTPVKSLLGGVRGSILDVYGRGEFEWDKFNVRFSTHRGADRGAEIRYGKNLSGLRHELDYSGVYNALAPYWTDDEGHIVMLPEIITSNEEGVDFLGGIRPAVMDFSGDFDEQPTANQLRARAEAYLAANEPWRPSETLTVNFVALWQTEEYKDVAPLERVYLGDTVYVVYPDENVHVKLEVVRAVYDVLEERYTELELGSLRSSFAQVIANGVSSDYGSGAAVVPGGGGGGGVSEAVQEAIDAAVRNATEKLTGATGGYRIGLFDSEGHPIATAYTDNLDITQAQNVFILNKNGLGFSRTGINGPFTNAFTIDGHFVADFIDTGTLDAAKINVVHLNASSVNVSNGYTVEQSLANLQSQIDGSVETYTGTTAPTLENEPAVSWTTDADKDSHVGDLYYVINDESEDNGHAYRFAKINNTYQWVLLEDSAVTKAIADAAKAASDIVTLSQELHANYSSTESVQQMINAGIDGVRSEMAQTYTTKAEYADGNDKLAARIDTEAQKRSELEQDIDGFKTSVSDTYVTKTTFNTDKVTLLNDAAADAQNKANAAKDAANGYTDDKLVSYSTKTEMQSAISQTANQIRTQVSENYTTKEEMSSAIEGVADDAAEIVKDGIYFGTRNLVLHTLVPSVETPAAYPRLRLQDTDSIVYNSAIETAEHGVKLTANGNETSMGITFFSRDLGGLEAGQQYVFGLELAGNLSVRCHIGLLADKSYKVSDPFYKVTDSEVGKDFETVRVFASFTVPEDASSVNIALNVSGSYLLTAGDWVELRNIKLEKGSAKGTDWTPAPEDVEGYTDSKVVGLVTMEEMNSSISQTAQEIRSDVSRVYQTMDAAKLDLEEAKRYADEIRAGVRNYIVNTLSPDAENLPRLLDQPRVTVAMRGKLAPVTHGIKNEATTAGAIGFRAGYYSAEDATLNGLKAGETYSFAADMKYKLCSGATDQSKVYNIRFSIWSFLEDGSDTSEASTLDAVTADKWGVEVEKRVTATFTVPENATGFCLAVQQSSTVHNAGDYIALDNMIIVMGNTPPLDWTPAPEDLSLDYTEQWSQINQRVDSIELEVGEKTSESEVRSLIKQTASSIRLLAEALSWTSSNSELTEDGTITLKAGLIGGWNINANCFYKDVTISGEQYRFFLQPPAGTGNNWILSSQKLVNGSYVGVWYIDEKGDIFAKRLVSRPAFPDGLTSGSSIVCDDVLGCKDEFYMTAGGKKVWALDVAKENFAFGPSGDDSGRVHHVKYNNVWGLNPVIDGSMTLGNPVQKWDTVYSNTGTIQTSDRKLKKSIKLLTKQAVKFILNLRPVRYVLKSDILGQKHWGLIAQEVEEAMQACGLSPDEYAALIKDDKGGYGLRYGELIAPMIATIQDLSARVTELENEVMKWQQTK